MASSPGSKDEPKKSRFRRSARGASPAAGEGRGSQFRQVIDMTRKNDPQAVAWVLGTFLAVWLVMVAIGFAIGHPFYLGTLGLFLALLAALFVFSRRANTAVYRSIQDQPGASAALLSSLGRGWRTDEEPVAAEMGRSRQVKDMSSAALVFRAIGRPGVVLVAEGPKGSATKLLESERKRTTRVLGPEVPVHLVRVGRDDEATAVGDVVKDIKKFPKALTDDETAKVAKRLRALSSGPRQGVPAGVDPNKVRVNRSAMRGR